MFRPLDPLFSPQSIAVIGASRDRGSIGFALLHNLISGEFEGVVYPVNPNANAIHSLRCYPTVGAIPDPVDLAVVLVARPRVAAVVDECLAKGVRGLVVITAGYGETGAVGRAAEELLRQRVRAAGARMIGPNCMGIINTAAGIAMNATFAPTPALAGSLGFVSQSGALGVAILNLADDLGVGITQFASMGNKADVSGNDLLEHWEDDPATQVICMYLESFGNPRRFVEIARRVSQKKPILVVKSGRTAQGERAASSHTGALAGGAGGAGDVTVSAFLEQCGVLRADTIEELFDLARAFDRCPLPAGPRLAIVTNAGGPAIMATDAAIAQGLLLAELAPETTAALAAFLPPEASLANPVDMIASATPTSYRRALEVVLADPSVDMALAINVTPLLSNPREVLEAVAAAGVVDRAGAGVEQTSAGPPIELRGVGKPVLAVMMANEAFHDEIKGRRDLPPVYRFPEQAARSLAQLARYAAWRRRPHQELAPELAIDHAAIAGLLAQAAAGQDAATLGEDGYLRPDQALRLLDLLGIPTASWRYARGRAAVLGAAPELAYPLVLKADASGLIHKSDVGAVHLGIKDETALADALDVMTARLLAAGTTARGFLIQEMVPGGRETILGLSNVPRLGPVLMFGLGGRYVEVFKDVRFAVPPLTRTDARELVDGIRGKALLDGVRGEAPADRGAIEDALSRLSALAENHPAIVELDINPFLVGPLGGVSVAVDVRVRLGESAATVDSTQPGTTPDHFRF